MQYSSAYTIKPGGACMDNNKTTVHRKKLLRLIIICLFTNGNSKLKYDRQEFAIIVSYCLINVAFQYILQVTTKTHTCCQKQKKVIFSVAK